MSAQLEPREERLVLFIDLVIRAGALLAIALGGSAVMLVLAAALALFRYAVARS